MFSNGSPIAFVACAVLAFSAPAQAQPQTFGEVLAKAADDHPLVTGARYLTEAGQADVAAARSAMRPQLSADANAGWTNRNGAGGSGIVVLPEIKVSQFLYDGGRTPAEVRRRKVRTELLGVQEEATLSDIAQRLSQAWIDYDRANALIAIGQEQVGALAALDRMVVEIAGFDRGRASDVVMVESRLNQATTALRSREIARDEARARISEIAASLVDPEGGVPDLSGLMPTSVEECSALADASPAVRTAALQVKESSAAVDATRNWWMPQLAVEGARTSELDGAGGTHVLNGFALRLRAVTLPFDSGAGKARNASARSSLSSARSNEEYARTALRDQVLRLWVLQSQKSERIPSLSALVGQADQAREIVFEQWRLGRRTILDVLSYDLERYNVRAQLVNEQFDVTQAQYQLLGVVGQIHRAVSDGTLATGGEP